MPPRLARLLKNKTQTLLLAAVTLVLLYFAFSTKGFLSRISLESENAEREERLLLLKRDIEALRREQAMLRDDEAAIEHVAREQHGMIKPGEIVYRILPAEDQAQ
ncbi:MAG TPA: septum formation initiator family protein [Bacteroidota bacterium]|nr:septum formation initiator family protein [Bacteroidota bacterium]